MPEKPLDTSPPPPPPAARTLANGRYKLVRKVAEGGTAIVHLGFDTRDSQWRAVKTLLPEYAKRPALRHRFEREAATMKALSHPNIITVHDAGADEETAWMVMEYAEGGSVIDWVERNGPMPPRMAAEVVLQLCEGIQAAHEEGIIHRDIKPQNLLVDRRGVCKVTDFGIAQVVQETRMTMTGTVMGTIGYMAPEQHESAKHADERADVYSIAATFYTLVKGEAATHLFMADEDEFEGLPSSLAEIVRRGSQYRRDARYGSVAEMARALRSALTELPPDPLDTPPLVPDDLLILDDVTPPSLATVEPRAAEAGDLVLRQDTGNSGNTANTGNTAGSLATRGSRETSVDPPSSPTDTTPSSVIPRRSLTGEGAHRRIRAYERHDRQTHRFQQLRVAAFVASVILGVSFLVLLAAGLLSANRLQRLGVQEQRERQELYAEFGEQVLILPVLEPLDLRSYGEVHDLFDKLERERDPVARRATARRLQELMKSDLLRELNERNSPSEVGPRKQLKATSDALEEALKEHATAERLIEEERQTLGGRIASFMGF